MYRYLMRLIADYRRRIEFRLKGGVHTTRIETYLVRRYFEEAANHLGIDCYMLGEDVMEFVLNGQRRRICELWTDLDTLPTGRIASNKPLCSTMLAEAGLPVPYFRVFSCNDRIDKILETIQEEFADRVVIKPAKGTSSGRGVVAGIPKNATAIIKRAIRKARFWSTHVLVEEFIRGENYRFLVCKGKVLSVVHRLPPFVIGNGKHTLRQLIRAENLKRKEKLNTLENAYAPPVLMPIKVDPYFLRRNHYRLGSIIPSENQVFCRQETNFATGGMYYEVIHKVHPDRLSIASCAAKIIGINLAGVDLICSDITLPANESQGKINEVNTTPGLLAHHEVMNQESMIPVANAVLLAMFGKDT